MGKAGCPDHVPKSSFPFILLGLRAFRVLGLYQGPTVHVIGGFVVEGVGFTVRIPKPEAAHTTLWV